MEICDSQFGRHCLGPLWNDSRVLLVEQLLGITAEALHWAKLYEVGDQLDPSAMKIAFIFILVGYGTKAGLYSPSSHRSDTWCRNIDLLSIDYAFRPRLRNRLTLRRLTWRRKPWVFGERVFHPF